MVANRKMTSLQWQFLLPARRQASRLVALFARFIGYSNAMGHMETAKIWF
jgi:hypothetical protein